MSQIFFDALDERHKQPHGALRLGERLVLNISLLRERACTALYLVLKKDGEDEVWYEAQWSCHQNALDSYRCEVDIGSSGLYFYYFTAFTRYGKEYIGADDLLRAQIGCGQSWQLTVFDEYYAPTDLLAGGIVYHIFVDRFNIGGERNKSYALNDYREDWGGIPRRTPNMRGEYAVDFFGGNLKGIIEKLDYLRSLNISTIYLSPIFEARSNHKYDTADYMRVDPDFGDIEDFESLCALARQKGISIILDGVFSHTGSDSIYFNKYGRYYSLGAYQSKQSPYYSWYRFKTFPHEYECWWGFKTLPNVNEDNAHYNEFINGENGVVRTWLRRGASGFRLDVADELPDIFLDNLTKAAKSQNPNALVLGEVWEDASNKVSYSHRRRFLEGRQLDSVMNYPLRTAIIGFVRGADARELARVCLNLENNYPKNVLNNLLNVLGTHDTERVLSAVGGKEALKTASFLQYFLRGTPCIFYGDEAGLQGGADPFCRACYPWGNEDEQLIEWYRALGRLRKQHSASLSNSRFELLNAAQSIFEFKRGDLTILVDTSKNIRRIVYKNSVTLL